MAFYKLESTYRVIANSGSKNKKTYKYFCDSWKSMKLRFVHDLELGAAVKVKEITEQEYVRNTR